MGVPNRLTKPRKVIPRIDPCLTKVPSEDINRYWETFDIEALGPLEELDSPTVIEIAPLKTNYSKFDRGEDKTADDCWIIFSTHVINIIESVIYW